MIFSADKSLLRLIFQCNITGCNLEDGPGHTDPYFLAIADAVKQDLLDLATIREAVKPMFYTRMRLGLFDPPEANPYAALDASKVVQSEEHRNLSRTLAMKTFVLLKNENSTLPFPSGKVFDKVAVSVQS